MTGVSYATSAEMAGELGAFPRFEGNRDAMLRVVRNHRRAAYGHADAPEVEALRRFRDRRLLTNRPGTAFVRLYYRLSPPIAHLIARKPRLRTAVKKTLDFLARRAASF